MTRRRFLTQAAGLAAGVTGIAGLPRLAMAQAEPYPSRPIKIILGSPPGAMTDTSARMAAEVLGRNLGTTIVENMPGANASIAARAVARARPDGYTLLNYYSDQMLVLPLVLKDRPYDPINDYAHISTSVKSGGFILAVPPSSPAKTWAEFEALARSGKPLNYGTYGIGSSVHLGFEIFNERWGSKMQHIPYKGGGPSYQAAMAGEVDIVAGTSFVELLKGGRLRPLAIGGKDRSPDFPAIPTLAELGMGELLFGPVFYGLAAPKGTPPDVLEKIGAAIARGMAAPEYTTRLKATAHEPFIQKPADTLAQIRRGQDAYRPVVQKLGVSIE